MTATVRNRRATVAAVDAFDTGPDGRIHVVRLEYTDPDGVPSDTVIWEREIAPTVLEPNALPLVDADPPMIAREFDALVRASRWSALTPFLDPAAPTKRGTQPVAAPLFGAVQVDDFQLVPVLRALQMPRVSLLLADDVGLGKTVEAGLILTELLLRRRARKVLVITPASLRRQWQQEMRDKFALPFDLVDRDETYQLTKRLGLDANPWRTFQRIVASYHYLRQPDVLEQFLATCRAPAASASVSAQLPWDLLIVDEAHNLMPANYGEESDLTQMLRAITPYFEHKLFLTATPHNGYTRSFTGLLSLLDPVRFTQTSVIGDAERRRVEDVVVRRLKSEINALDDRAGRPRRFGERHLEPLHVYFNPAEQRLNESFAAFRRAVRRHIAASRRSEQLAGSFAVEVLNKRLLSGAATFADSWFRFTAGLRDTAAVESAGADAVEAARTAVEEDIDDDAEREGRARFAAETVGAWIRPFVERLANDVSAIDDALAGLGLSSNNVTVSAPSADARIDRLLQLVRQKLRVNNAWRADERLIVFTEYKTTLDYVVARLLREFGRDTGAIRTLYGGMAPGERDAIKDAFNDPADPVRILVATDAASEGLNLQATARFILHYEIPWNPSRLEQRNGRLDRHGQARDVTVHHFTSASDADLTFIEKVVAKIHEIRDDLGSLGQLFDAAFQRQFLHDEAPDSVINAIDRDTAAVRGMVDIPRARSTTTGVAEASTVDTLRAELDLDADSLRDTLAVAMGAGTTHGGLRGPDSRGRMEIAQPIAAKWRAVQEAMRLEDARGALPGLVFDPAHFIDITEGRPIFRPRRDTILLHLGHPAFRHAIALFARARFPGGNADSRSSRWLATLGTVPSGADAVVVLTVEELAVNDLREPIHHWVRALHLPVYGRTLHSPLPHQPANADRSVSRRAIVGDPTLVRRAREVWDDIRDDVRGCVTDLARARTATVTSLLDAARMDAATVEAQRFDQRRAEVEAAMRQNTVTALERERDAHLAKARQLDMFRTEQETRDTIARIRAIDDELRDRSDRLGQHLETLDRERARVLDRLVPLRFRMRDTVHVYPVAVEIRLPETAR
jgi:superfamily II DNA or RNA helicase